MVIKRVSYGYGYTAGQVAGIGSALARCDVRLWYSHPSKCNLG